jgi:hypothetical protein
MMECYAVPNFSSWSVALDVVGAVWNLGRAELGWCVGPEASGARMTWKRRDERVERGAKGGSLLYISHVA